jgi:hypothetical protein
MFALSLIYMIYSIEIELSSYKDEQYYGEISVDKKNFSVVFDTGSNLAWVQGNNTTMVNCEGYEDCRTKCYSSVNAKSEMIYFIKYGTGFVGITNTKGNISFSDGNDLVDNEYGLSVFEDKNIFSKVMTV